MTIPYFANPSGLKMLALTLLLVSPAAARVTFTGGFESGGLQGWGREIAGPEHCQVVRAPVRNGKYAARLICTRGQPDVSGSKRAELTHMDSGGPNTTHTECWFGWSLYLPADWTIDPQSPEIVTQWHELPDVELGETWRSPPVALTTQGDRYYFNILWDARRVTPGNSPQGRARLEAGRIAPGQWTDWVLHIKWSYGADGLLEVWKDGVKVIEHRGPNGYNDRRPTYFKIGVYKWEWKEHPERSVATRREIVVDEVRMGDKASNYEEVAPQPAQPRRSPVVSGASK